MFPLGQGLFFFLAGTALSSFSLATVYRLERDLSLWARSACEGCSKSLGPLDLIPLLGWVFRRGACPHCAYKIPLRYPLLELAGGILALGLYLWGGAGPETYRALALWFGLGLISWLDFKTGQIYTLPIVFLAVLQGLYLGLWAPEARVDSLIGLLCGAGFFYWVSLLYRFFRGRDGLGEGDASLLGLLGFTFGWSALLPLVFLSACLGVIGGVSLIIAGKTGWSDQLPYGPYLALSAALYAAAPEFWEHYFHLF